jgi:hypothetical protein
MDQVTAGCEIIKSVDIDSFGGLKITFKNGDVLKATAGTKFHSKV